MNDLCRIKDSAIESRRKIAEMPELRALTQVEQAIYKASTGRMIEEYSDAELVQELKMVFQFAAMDIGYQIPDKDMWAYQLTRLTSIIKMYYPKRTIKDFSMAFELLSVGELDMYLPKKMDGSADRSHYQRLNAEFVSKVMKAYERKLGDVQCKVYGLIEHLPAPTEMIENASYTAKMKDIAIEAFEQFKESGSISASPIQQMLIYNLLAEKGIAKPVQITDEDKQKSIMELIKITANRYTKEKYRNAGKEHQDAADLSLWEARERALRSTFEEMKNNNINLNEVLK